jgi:hypothetical protein
MMGAEGSFFLFFTHRIVSYPLRQEPFGRLQNDGINLTRKDSGRGRACLLDRAFRHRIFLLFVATHIRIQNAIRKGWFVSVSIDGLGIGVALTGSRFFQDMLSILNRHGFEM